MDAIREALNIMNRAIDSRERVKQSILTNAAKGHCWNCAKIEKCRPENDDDTCDSWEAF